MPITAQPQMTLDTAREVLFKNASQPPLEQMPEIFTTLKKLLDELTVDLLWPMVKDAHEAAGIPEKGFLRNLFGQYRSNGKVYSLLTRGDRWDSLADPYTQLDLKAWCNYLIHGGGVRFDLTNNRINTDDHRAVFPYIHPPRGFVVDEYKEFRGWLDILLNGRNVIEHESYATADMEFLAKLLYAVVNILQNMRPASRKERCDWWIRRLCREFFEAVGETDYRLSDICGYLTALRHPVTEHQLERLMRSAEMAVDNGKVSYSGDILLLMGEALPAPLELAQTDPKAAAAMLKKATRGPLPPYAQLTYAQKERTIALLEEYSPKLKEYLVAAIREAHRAAGIQPQEFHNRYTAPNQTRTDESGNTYQTSLADGDYRNHPETDYYKRLDLQGWLKYLRYGGSRQDAGGAFLQDQDLVFAYLGIPYSYKQATPRALDCEIGEHLARLMDARNDISSHWTAATIRKTTTKEIMQWYEALLAFLRPMGQTQWQEAKTCAQLARELEQDFREALGGLSYAVADILDYLKLSASLQPEVETRLRELGFSVTDGCVAVAENIEEFLVTLPAVLRLARDFHRLPESAEEAQRLYIEICGQRRASDQRAVAWFEKAARATPSMPAACYYLGCCGMFVRGLYADSHEIMAWLHLAAKKGYGSAQVRMGQYREGWYPYLETPLYREDSPWANENLRADAPENTPAWKEKTQEQREKRIDPAAALGWYQKAADREDPDGLYHLGRCCGEGIGMAADAFETYQYFWEAAQQGHKPARFALAQCYDGELPGICVQREKAWSLYEALAAEKYIPAIKTLARRYTVLPKGRDLIKAAELMAQAGGLGDASAYTELAHWFLDGKLVQPHEEEGIRWLKQAAKGKDPQALRVLGECCLYGIGVPQNSAAAGSLLGEAKKAGELLAQWSEGNRLAQEDNFLMAKGCFQRAQPHSPMLKALCDAADQKSWAALPNNTEAGEFLARAIELLLPLARKEDLRQDAACFVKDPSAAPAKSIAESLQDYLREYCTDRKAESGAWQPAWEENTLFNRLDEARLQRTQAIIRYELAECYQMQGDMTQAVYWYTKAAEQGFFKAMVALGRCYAQGAGVEPDAEKARQWYDKAAAATDGRVLCHFAEKCRQKDAAEVVYWYTKAAEKGDAGAMCVLGRRYERGADGTPDSQKARQWYEKAADTGNRVAMYELAEFFRRQDDMAQVLHWYKQSAEKGYVRAMMALGNWYDQDTDGEGDAEIARQWYEKAAGAGSSKAMCLLAQRQLQRAQILPEGAEARKAREEAVALYLQAYCRGDEEAEAELARLGIKPDEELKRQRALNSALCDPAKLAQRQLSPVEDGQQRSLDNSWETAKLERLIDAL